MQARIVSAQQTGAMINFQPQVQVVLEVNGPQGPYQVQTTSSLVASLRSDIAVFVKEHL